MKKKTVISAILLVCVTVSAALFISCTRGADDRLDDYEPEKKVSGKIRLPEYHRKTSQVRVNHQTIDMRRIIRRTNQNRIVPMTKRRRTVLLIVRNRIMMNRMPSGLRMKLLKKPCASLLTNRKELYLAKTWKK